MDSPLVVQTASLLEASPKAKAIWDVLMNLSKADSSIRDKLRRVQPSLFIAELEAIWTRWSAEDADVAAAAGASDSASPKVGERLRSSYDLSREFQVHTLTARAHLGLRLLRCGSQLSPTIADWFKQELAVRPTAAERLTLAIWMLEGELLAPAEALSVFRSELPHLQCRREPPGASIRADWEAMFAREITRAPRGLATLMAEEIVQRGIDLYRMPCDCTNVGDTGEIHSDHLGLVLAVVGLDESGD
jgi:hypothetical protein